MLLLPNLQLSLLYERNIAPDIGSNSISRLWHLEEAAHRRVHLLRNQLTWCRAYRAAQHRHVPLCVHNMFDAQVLTVPYVRKSRCTLAK